MIVRVKVSGWFKTILNAWEEVRGESRGQKSENDAGQCVQCSPVNYSFYMLRHTRFSGTDAF